MQRVALIVAAALGGWAITTLTVATLALGAGDTRDALVTLQVAPRGPGQVSAVPVAGGTAQECTGNRESNDCTFTYERGTPIRLTAIPVVGKSFSGWSDPECGTNLVCILRVDDDHTSAVAVFAPLVLAVKFSQNPGGATVTARPGGLPCGDDAPDDDEVFCALFAPHTPVELTVHPSAIPFSGWTTAGEYLCEPANAPTCTIQVEDEPTWAGAVFGAQTAPPLATSISVEFKLRKSGNGSGRVTASKLDCGTVCTASYGFGKAVALTAEPEEGSIFDGWNGVCGRAQLTCRFPAGPITSIRASFVRDATPPTTPGSPAAAASTRTGLTISWSASTDNVRVTGYRVYVDGAPAGETQSTSYALQGLRCGRRYAVAVDAVDTLGNRSQRADFTAETRPCALAARLAGVRVTRTGSARTVIATLRANRATTARLRLLLRGRTLVAGRFRVVPGSNALRLRVPAHVPRGSYRLSTTLVNPDGGSLVLPGRGLLLRGP